MKFSKFNLYFCLLIVGFLCIVLDFNVTTSLTYPKQYENTKQVIGEFQYYNIASNYNAYCDYKLLNSSGNVDIISPYENSSQAHYSTTAKVINNIYYKNLQIDLFNDFIGFLLIFIASMGFSGCGRRFRFGAFTALCSFVIHGIIVFLPFFANGLLLCYLAFFIGAAYLASSLITMFFVTYGLFRMCPGVSCRDERKWCKILWYIIFSLQILTTFIFWVGADFDKLYHLGMVMQYINVIMVLFFWRILSRAKGHIEESYINRKK